MVRVEPARWPVDPRRSSEARGDILPLSMETNPYQAPATSAVAGGRQVVFSDEGLAIVQSLSRWMSFLGILYYLGGAFAVLGGVTFLAMPGGAFGVVPFLLVATFVFVAGTWLRTAGNQFARGVAGDDVGTLGAGFRTLRRYLILFGVIEGLQLAFVMLGLAL